MNESSVVAHNIHTANNASVAINAPAALLLNSVVVAVAVFTVTTVTVVWCAGALFLVFAAVHDHGIHDSNYRDERSWQQA